MYLTIEETAEYLEVPVHEVHRWIRERQVRTVQVDGQTLLYKEQFNLFLKERKKQKAALEEYLNTPIPEDVDIKDED
ncbi:helix-turn-helix domain-containing protein [Jeotgalibaca caeni]|uniref:helix-turn-helix domain-containing protein n=1 Tax=Jeotgalibaca caeni TaxID=3028623 RepID=UPI00237DEC27|nr:helix-turn-helix domain-containing protein [Jeotgalibaca caeni]MDE1548895.1 helix-turn-helix domain-containing protein [Jeotgalibaca caeni]